MFNKPIVIDFKKASPEEYIDIINNNQSKNVFGYNLTEEDYEVVLSKCSFVKYNETAKTIAGYNHAFIRSKERVGIVCNNRKNHIIMEQLFEALVVFGLKGRRIPLYKDIKRISDISTCDYIINIDSDDIEFNDISVIKYTNILESVNKAFELIK